MLSQSSRAGISYSDFWKMTPNEYAAYMHGYTLRQHDEWRRTRTLYALIYNTHVEPHNQLKPEQLIPLNSDEQQSESEETNRVGVRYLNDEEREKLLKRDKR